MTKSMMRLGGAVLFATGFLCFSTIALAGDQTAIEDLADACTKGQLCGHPNSDGSYTVTCDSNSKRGADDCGGARTNKVLVSDTDVALLASQGGSTCFIIVDGTPLGCSEDQVQATRPHPVFFEGPHWIDFTPVVQQKKTYNGWAVANCCDLGGDYSDGRLVEYELINLPKGVEVVERIPLYRGVAFKGEKKSGISKEQLPVMSGVRIHLRSTGPTPINWKKTGAGIKYECVEIQGQVTE